jgi:hypothetical protein
VSARVSATATAGRLRSFLVWLGFWLDATTTSPWRQRCKVCFGARLLRRARLLFPRSAATKRWATAVHPWTERSLIKAGARSAEAKAKAERAGGGVWQTRRLPTTGPQHQRRDGELSWATRGWRGIDREEVRAEERAGGSLQGRLRAVNRIGLRCTLINGSSK